jgi:hypothetical protein
MKIPLLVSYRSRARTNNIEYERESMFNGVILMAFVAGLVRGGLSCPLAVILLIIISPVLHSHLSSWADKMVLSTKPLTRCFSALPTLNHCCSKMRISNIAVDIFMKHTVLCSLLYSILLFLRSIFIMYSSYGFLYRNSITSLNK